MHAGTHTRTHMHIHIHTRTHARTHTDACTYFKNKKNDGNVNAQEEHKGWTVAQSATLGATRTHAHTHTDACTYTHGRMHTRTHAESRK